MFHVFFGGYLGKSGQVFMFYIKTNKIHLYEGPNLEMLAFSFRFRHVQSEDASSYRCVFRSAHQTAVSNSAELAVKGKSKKLLNNKAAQFNWFR